MFINAEGWEGSLGALFWREIVRVAGLGDAQLLEALHHDGRKAASAALAGRTQSAEERCVALQSLEAVRVRPDSTVYFGDLPGTASHSTLHSRPPSTGGGLRRNDCTCPSQRCAYEKGG